MDLRIFYVRVFGKFKRKVRLPQQVTPSFSD